MIVTGKKLKEYADHIRAKETKRQDNGEKE
jgi:hypothetical protein